MKADVFAALAQADRWRQRCAAGGFVPLESPVSLVMDAAPSQRDGVRRGLTATFVRPA